MTQLTSGSYEKTKNDVMAEELERNNIPWRPIDGPTLQKAADGAKKAANGQQVSAGDASKVALFGPVPEELELTGPNIHRPKSDFFLLNGLILGANAGHQQEVTALRSDPLHADVHCAFLLCVVALIDL